MAFRRTKKLISFLAAFFFFISSVSWAAPAPNVILNSNQFEPKNNPEIQIPSELASIKDIFYPSDTGKTPFIIHIQTAHANYETALKVEKIIRYLKDRYGVNLLFVEGASQKLHPEFLNFLSDSKQNRKFLDVLAQKGELTGADLALFDSKIQALGVESPDFYWAAFKDFKKVVSNSNKSEKFIEGQKRKLDRKASKVFSPGFRELLETWQKYQANCRDFTAVIKLLLSESQKSLQLDFQDLFSQFEWPQLTRFALLQELEKRINPIEFQKDKDKLNIWFQQNKISSKFLKSLESQDSIPRSAYENFIAQAYPLGFRFKDYPQVTYKAAYKILQSELDASALFGELDNLFEKLFRAKALKKVEMKLFGLYKELLLLQKLLNLDLSREEWKKFKHVIARRSQGPTKQSEGSEIASLTAFARNDTYRSALHFYELSERRENAFYQNLKQEMDKQNSKIAILMTGGFHSEGMSQIFKQKGIGYLSILPHISEATDSSLYHQVMLGQAHLDKPEITQPAGTGTLIDPEYVRSELHTVKTAYEDLKRDAIMDAYKPSYFTDRENYLSRPFLRAVRSEVRTNSILATLPERLKTSGRFTPAHALLHARVMEIGVAQFVQLMRKSPEAVMNGPEMQTLLTLAQRSYELASLYLAGLIRSYPTTTFSPIMDLLGGITQQAYQLMPAAEIALLEYKSQVLVSQKTKQRIFHWFNADKAQLLPVAGITQDAVLVAAGSQILSALQSMVRDGFDLVNYIESQPVLRLSDLPFGRPDIRWVRFDGRIAGGKLLSFISKKYSGTSGDKIARGLEEFRLTRKIAAQIGTRQLAISGFEHPVTLSVPVPRIFLNTQNAAYLLSDFVPGAKTMNDFLLGLSHHERQPYLRLLRSLLEFFIADNIYWAAPNLRNILINVSDTGQVHLSLVDFDKSKIGPVAEAQRKSMMLQFWRGAHGLESEERHMVTRGYFDGPEILDDNNEIWSEPQTNFARMMTMDPSLNIKEMSEKDRNRYLKKRIEVFEMENIESPDGGNPIPFAAIEHQLRFWYDQKGFSKPVFYDVLYDLYLKDSESGSTSRKAALSLLWEYFKLDWINEEAHRFGFSELAADQKTFDSSRSLAADFTAALWLADLLGIEDSYLKNIKNQGEEIRPWKVLRELLAATEMQMPLSPDSEAWSSFLRHILPALSRKIRRFHADLKIQAEHPIVAEPDQNTIHIYYLGQKSQAYESAFHSQFDRLMDLLEREPIILRSEMRQGEGKPNILLHWGGASDADIFVLEHADGGQDLRNALAFSAILKRPIYLANIRPDSHPSGMRTAHVLPIDVLREMTNARVAPYAYQSRSLFFFPGEIHTGKYKADIQSIQRGSRSLAISGIQAILPVALFADGLVTVDLHGGTSLPRDMSSLYQSRVFFPFVQRKLGIQAQLDILRQGWDGHGHVQLKTVPLSHPLPPQNWTNRGDLKKFRVILHKSQLGGTEAETVKGLRGRIQQSLSDRFPGIPVTIEEEDITEKSFDGKALAILLMAEYQTVPAGFSDLYLFGHGQSPDPKEVWQGIFDRFVSHHKSDAALDPNLADQILIYLALAEGESVFTVSEVTDHLSRGQRILNDLMNGRGNVEIQRAKGKPSRVIVRGMGLKPDARWIAKLKVDAEQYGFYGNTGLFLQWVDDWARLIGTNRIDILSRLDANQLKHVFPRAMFIPEEMEAYLLRVAKASQDTGMKPVFIERVAAPFARYYRSLAASIRAQMNVPLKDSRTIKLSRLEHSGMDKRAFLEQYPNLTFPTTILSPTLNTLLSSVERETLISDKEKQRLRSVYDDMDSADREALDGYLKSIWGVTGGFDGLVNSQMRRAEWIKYLADWRIDPRYLNYIYQQKKIQSWNGGVSGPDHEALLNLWDRVFEGHDKIQASTFVANLARELGGDLGAAVYSKNLSIQKHIHHFADKDGNVHRYQDKVLFKIYRLLIADFMHFKDMRHGLTHGARPFLNVLLQGTDFYQEAADGMIFVDEVSNGGETTLYAELIGKSFVPDFKYQFFILAQTHPELGRMYEQQKLVDGVLSEKGIHAVEDFPELMEAFYPPDEKHSIFKAGSYEERLAAVRHEIALQDVNRLQEVRQKRDRNIEKLLEDERLRDVSSALDQLESNRHSSTLKLSDELVKQFLRKRRRDIQPIDKYVIPNAFLSGITAFSNRDYPTIDRQWKILAEFEARLSELEPVQRPLFHAIDEGDREVRLLDENDYLEQWIYFQTSLYSRIQGAYEELFQNNHLAEDYLNGKLSHPEFVKQILSNGNYHRSEVKSSEVISLEDRNGINTFLSQMRDLAKRLGMDWEANKNLHPSDLMSLVGRVSHESAEVKREVLVRFYEIIFSHWRDLNKVPEQPAVKSVQAPVFFGVTLRAPYDLEISLKWDETQRTFTKLEAYAGAGGGAAAVTRYLRSLDQSAGLMTFTGSEAFGTAYRQSVERRGQTGYFITTKAPTKVNLRLRVADETAELKEASVSVTREEAERLVTQVERALVDYPQTSYWVLGGGAHRSLEGKDFGRMIKRIRDQGKTAVMDLSASLVSDPEAVADILKAGPSVLKANQSEFKALLATAGLVTEEQYEGWAVRPKYEWDSIAARWSRRLIKKYGIQMLLVTLGGDGALAITESEALKAFSKKSIQAVDPVTAGDHFLGGVLVSLHRRQPLSEALVTGVASGVLAVSEYGSRPVDVSKLDGQKKNVHVRRIVLDEQETSFEKVVSSLPKFSESVLKAGKKLFEPGAASESFLDAIRQDPSVVNVSWQAGILTILGHQSVLKIHDRDQTINERWGLQDRFYLANMSPGVPDLVIKSYARDERDSRQLNGPVYVLGVTRSGHDAAAVLIKDGRVLGAVEEERFDRNKHTNKYFPAEAVKSLLQTHGISWDDISHLAVTYDFNYFVDTPHSLAPRHAYFDYIGEPVPAGQKERYDPERLRQYLRKFAREFDSSKVPPVTFVRHHKAHAISTWQTSPFGDDPTLVVVIDGKGEDESTSIWLGKDGEIRRLGGSLYPNSLGLLYRVATKYIGYQNHDESKVMGLAPYGYPENEAEKQRVDALRVFFDRLIQFNDENGELTLNPEFVDSSVAPGARIGFSERFMKELEVLVPRLAPSEGGSRLMPEIPKDRPYVNFAFVLQEKVEAITLALIKYYKRLYPETSQVEHLVLSGGSALNIAANGKIVAAGLVDSNKFLVPAFPADNGTPIGAALSVSQEEYGSNIFHPIEHVGFGRVYSDQEIREVLDRFGLQEGRDYERLKDDKTVVNRVSDYLTGGRTVAWFHGGSEFGPRALGHRSLLHLLTDPEGNQKVNELKRREWWRPSALSMTEEAAPNFLELKGKSPFMTVAFKVRQEHKERIVAGLHPYPLDGTTRPQTVSRGQQPLYWALLNEIGNRTGVPGLLNTSFNRSEPIVEHPSEALNTFYYSGGVDELSMGHFLIRRTKYLKPSVLALSDEPVLRDLYRQAVSKDTSAMQLEVFWQTLVFHSADVHGDTVTLSGHNAQSQEISIEFPLFKELFSKITRRQLFGSLEGYVRRRFSVSNGTPVQIHVSSALYGTVVADLFERFTNLQTVRSEVRSESPKKKPDVQDFHTFAENFVAAYSENIRKQMLPEKLDQILQAIRIVEQVYRKRGRVFITGNGEAAALAGHLVVDFAKGTAVPERGRLSVIPLGELSWISALGNDVDFAKVYSEQLQNHALGKDDVLIVIRPRLQKDESLDNAVNYARQGNAAIIQLGHEGLTEGTAPGKEIALTFGSGDWGGVDAGVLSFDHIMVESLKKIIAEGVQEIDDLSLKGGIRNYYERELEYLEHFDPGVIKTWMKAVHDTLNRRGRIFVLGNGGHVPTSNWIASKLKKQMRAGILPEGVVIPLTERTEMTGLARDEGYANIFVRQLEPILKPSDLIIAMSTSGNSENVIRALKLAHERSVNAIGVYGFTKGRMEEMPYLFVKIPDSQEEHHYGRTEDLLMLTFSLFSEALQNSRRNDTPHGNQELAGFYATQGADYFRTRGTGTKNLAKEVLYGKIFSQLLPQGASTLDIGAGFGHLVNEFSRRGFHATAVDISAELLQEARETAKAQGIENITYQQGNALDLPIPSNSQNAVTITNVVEHFDPKEAQQFMTEAQRVLKKDGYLLIGVPYRSTVSRLKLLWRRLTDPYVWKNWGKVIDDTGDLTHKIWFDGQKLTTLFEENNFEIVSTDYFVYRTAEWPRGKWIHQVQRFLDKYDKGGIVKRNLAYGVYILGRKMHEEDSSLHLPQKNRSEIRWGMGAIANRKAFTRQLNGGRVIADISRSYSDKAPDVKTTLITDVDFVRRSESRFVDQSTQALAKLIPRISGLELPFIEGMDWNQLIAAGDRRRVTTIAVGGVLDQDSGIIDRSAFEKLIATVFIGDKNPNKVLAEIAAVQDALRDGVGIQQKQKIGQSPVILQVDSKALDLNDRESIAIRLADLPAGSVVIEYVSLDGNEMRDILSGLMRQFPHLQYLRKTYRSKLRFDTVYKGLVQAAKEHEINPQNAGFLTFDAKFGNEESSEKKLESLGIVIQFNPANLPTHARLLKGLSGAVFGELAEYAKLDRQVRDRVLAEAQSLGVFGSVGGAYSLNLDLWIESRQVFSSAA